MEGIEPRKAFLFIIIVPNKLTVPMLLTNTPTVVESASEIERLDYLINWEPKSSPIERLSTMPAFHNILPYMIYFLPLRK